MDKDYRAVDVIKAAIAASEMPAEEKTGLHAQELYFSIFAGRGEAFNELQRLFKTSLDNSVVISSLARAHRHYQEHNKAAAMFEQASEIASSKIAKVEFLGDAISNHVLAERWQGALAALDMMRRVVSESGEGREILLESLREYYEARKIGDLSIAALESLAEQNPGDGTRRFQLALAHSECKRHDVALYHYLKIEHEIRDGGNWNNLGVEYHWLDLPAKSVAAYQKAVDQSETLAMANLARNYKAKGFLKEAEDLCRKALEVPNCNQDVGQVLSEVQSTLEQEGKSEAELVKKAKPKSEFFRVIGNALVQETPTRIAKRWQGPNCILTVEIEGKSFVAKGSYTLADSALASMFSGNRQQQTTYSDYEVTYEGTISGRVIQGQVTNNRAGEIVANSLLTIPKSKNVTLVIREGDNQIGVSESPEVDGRRYTLDAIQESSEGVAASALLR